MRCRPRRPPAARSTAWPHPRRRAVAPWRGAPRPSSTLPRRATPAVARRGTAARTRQSRQRSRGGSSPHQVNAVGSRVMAAFRFALQVSRTPSAGEWRDLARKAEDLGYATLYVPDHLDDQWAPMVALAVAAEATTTMRVGTLVLDNDFRHPVLMAKEAATLDAMTDGRFELGLGAGWLRTDYDQSGIPMDPPAARIER